MIASFGDAATAQLFHGDPGREQRKLPANIRRLALRKLDMLNAARALTDLQAPPGNRLEALKGEWIGYFSIRINLQWRIIFRWEGTKAFDVRILDYHRG